LRIAELPVVFHPRLAGQSKISGNFRGSLKAGWGILCMVAKLWLIKRTGNGARHETPAAPRDSQAATFSGNKPCCISSKVVNRKP
ncbi:MAG: hypothetical protein L0Y58_01265, partial [Verrucomicrobia subdivision 3 bacterium]|nr:hypothetical protein [Limisphaerales bacterium]